MGFFDVNAGTQIIILLSEVLGSSYRTCRILPCHKSKLFQSHPCFLDCDNGKFYESRIVTSTLVKVLVEDDKTQDENCRAEDDSDCVKPAKHFDTNVKHFCDSN